MRDGESGLLLGGWLPPIAVAPFTWIPGIIWFVLKTCVFLHVRDGEGLRRRAIATMMMRLGWKVFLPISLAMVAIVAGVLQFTGWAPC